MARRSVRLLTPIDAAAACMEAVPVTQRRNAWNWAIRVPSSRLRTLLVWQNRISSAAFPPRLFRSCALASRTCRTALPSVISLVPCSIAWETGKSSTPPD